MSDKNDPWFVAEVRANIARANKNDTWEVGMRAFTNDLTWGTVVTIDQEARDAGRTPWHDVLLDSGRKMCYDPSRLSTRGTVPDPRKG